jgi:hypothetical protein
MSSSTICPVLVHDAGVIAGDAVVDQADIRLVAAADDQLALVQLEHRAQGRPAITTR